jgi:hypothetical protein
MVQVFIKLRIKLLHHVVRIKLVASIRSANHVQLYIWTVRIKRAALL